MEPRVDTPPWTGTVESLLARLETDPAAGLSSAEARRRLERDGPNRLVESPPVPWWWKFLDQFRDLVIVILLVAALLAGLVGEWIDSAAIIAIVVLNAVLSFVQENRAERALAALKNMASPHARVRRDGRIVDAEASSLVVGDLLEIEAGDRIPADARLLQAFSLQASEAALTGESVPVDKDSRSEVAAEAPIDARRNILFMGTVATSGKAVAVAVAVGMQTELGRIAGLLQQTEREPTPLQKQLAVLGKTLAAICLGLVGLILVLQILRHEELRSLLLAGNLSGFLRAPETLETFLVSISLAVAAVPEGLPAVVTVALALGVQRMVRRNALVRELSSVETLGCVQVICSDKTGTLTRNEMTVREFVTPDAAYEVTGAGYRSAGEFLRKSEAGAAAPVAPLQEPALARALEVAAWCRTAVVSALPNGEGWQVIGDPTEGALLVAARKAGVEEAPPPRMIHQIPFDSERKLMSVVVRDDRHRERMYSKGAVESLLPRCTHWLRNGARAARRRRTPQDSRRHDRDGQPCAARAGARGTRRRRRSRSRGQPHLRRAGRHDRPAARRSPPGGRHLPPRRHAPRDDHGRPPGNGRRHCPGARHRRARGSDSRWSGARQAR
jgi:Ca2+-transporting ATPase